MYTGIDIGGTKCAVILGDENAAIVDKIKFDTTTVDETYKRIVDAVRALGAGEAIGISCGGPLDAKTALSCRRQTFPAGMMCTLWNCWSMLLAFRHT